MAGRVLILGGGLAGLAAASALAPRGFKITLLESRNRIGGRAGSFQDATTGQIIDACQHVSMGCCTNFAHFCRSVGIDHLLQPQACLYFMTLDRRISEFRATGWPAPFHLARSFRRLHYLTLGEKMRIAWGLACLKAARVDGDPPFFEWLRRHRQSENTIERFWSVVLTSALNETPERIGLRYARKVFVDGFLRHRRGFEVQLPTVPLGRLYGEELQRWYQEHDVQIRLNQAVKTLVVDHGVKRVELRQGDAMTADWYISTLPFDRFLDVLPADCIEEHEVFRNLKNLETSPISSVHLWYDRSILELPHVVLVGGVGQWIFNRGEVAPGEHYVQVVISASRQFKSLRHEEVLERIIGELAGLCPQAKPQALLRSRVVTERQATFSAVPGVDQWRPPQSTPIDNLFLAGDWTATGWPATMEGAVRSGYLAAEALLKRTGAAAAILQPDL